MIMTLRNYKDHSKVCIQGTQTIELLTIILLTGAGPNFIRKETMPDNIEQITQDGASPNISDANGNRIRMERRTIRR